MKTQSNPLLKQVKNNLTVSHRSSDLLSRFDIPGLRLTSPFDIDSKEEIFELNREYSLDDFLEFYDIEFIVFCYRALLDREPDEQSMKNMLHALRVHKKPRVDILHRIAHSEEAAPHGIQIVGLKSAYRLNRLSNIRVIGFFVRLFLGIRRLSTLKMDQEHARGLLEAARQESFHRDESMTSNQNKVSQWLAKETGNHDWHLK